MNNYSEFLELAKSLVIKGGTICKDAQTHVIEYSHKPQEKSHIVTKYDSQIETLYSQTILAKYPDHSILGEENGSHKGSSDYQWLIDPIDGTSNFSKNIPIFATLIALAYKKEVVLGVTYIPTLNQLYSAVKGQGAYMNNTQITVGSTTGLEDSFAFYNFGSSDGTEWVSNMITVNSDKLKKIRFFGSCGVQIAYVADGRCDLVFVKGAKPYDMAAGSILITEAGGKTTDFDGNPWTLNSRNLLGGNSYLVDCALNQIDLR